MLMNKVTCGAIVAMLAGTTASVYAQQKDTPQKDRQSQNQQGNTPMRQPTASAMTPELIRYSEMTGMSVYNDEDKSIGDITEAIVDRGNGRIAYVVVKTGDLLGFGGTAVAVPYSAFKWNHTENRVVLESTKEQLKGWPTFERTSWKDAIGKQEGAREGQLNNPKLNSDPNADAIREAEVVAINGTVTHVRRITGEGEEAVVITIKEQLGTEKTVVVGPAWFVMGAESAPQRTDTVQIQAYKPTRAAQGDYIAQAVTRNGKTMAVRDSAGRAAWQTEHDASSSDSDLFPTRYLLLGDMVGKPSKARAEDCGEIQNAIIECQSGTVSFLAIDPNEKFLGLGDDLHLVPWSIARFDGKQVYLDASHDMIVNSLKLPDDLSTIENAAALRNAYQRFDVEEPNWMPQKTAPLGAATHHGWNLNDAYAQGVVHGTAMSIKGTVQEVRTVTPVNGMARATALSIKTTDGVQEVILGPESYVAGQAMHFEPGDVVELDCKRSVMGNRELITACTVNHEGRMTAIWRNNVPAWGTE